MRMTSFRIRLIDSTSIKQKMFPKWHFIMALIASAILLFLNWQWWQILLFFVAAFFIDVDHYFYFVWKKKSWSLKKAYRYFLKPLKEKHIMIFHTIEVFAILLALSFAFFEILFPMLLGFLIHNFFDIIAPKKAKRYKREFSLICYLKTR